MRKKIIAGLRIVSGLLPSTGRKVTRRMMEARMMITRYDKTQTVKPRDWYPSACKLWNDAKLDLRRWSDQPTIGKRIPIPNERTERCARTAQMRSSVVGVVFIECNVVGRVLRSSPPCRCET